MNAGIEPMQSDPNGYLDRDSIIKGDLVFEETFRVEGEVKGNIHSDGMLILGSEATVVGRVQVAKVLVLGEVRGSIVGKKSIEIGATGRVFADIVTPSLVIVEGGVLHGNCNMPNAKPNTGSRTSTTVSAAGPL